MIHDLHPLPPGFLACAVPGDPFAAALAGTATIDPGTVLWAEAAGRCRWAVMLAPDRDITQPTLTALGLLALYDALAVLAPPQVPIDVTDAGLRVDGGRAAWVRTACPDDACPDWAVIAVEVVLASTIDNPGDALDETSLAEEGFGGLTAQALMAGFCRHLLAWIDTWRDDGAASLARAVTERTPQRKVSA